MLHATTKQTPRRIGFTPALLLLVPVLAPAAWAEDLREADSVRSPFPLVERVAPVPRSLELANAFPTERQVLLPALGPDDQVRWHEDPPMIGRVFPQELSSARDGAWTTLEDGSRLWTLELVSPNAESLRVRFEPFRPPLGAELIVYNPERTDEAWGPYTALDAHPVYPFWAPTIYGQRVRVEYYLPAHVEPKSQRGVLTITGVVQNFARPPELRDRDDCALDASCYPQWATEMQAVAHITFVDGGNYICTGALINRTTMDFDPLFLTAGHCISDDAVAHTIEVFWFYQSESCDGDVPPISMVPRTTWATHLTSDLDADCTLLGLKANEIPADVSWAGFDASLAYTGTPAVMIHHPLGKRKSYSQGMLQGIEDVSQCYGTAYDTYDYELSVGGQAGGSSGAPVFDYSQRIRAVATCSSTDECVPDEDTGEGSLHHAFDHLAEYLAARSVVYVDWNTPCEGWTQDGSPVCPWDGLLEGYYGVLGGGTIYIHAGSYSRTNFDGVRAMTLSAYGGTVVIGQ